MSQSLESLQQTWKQIYASTLPSLAKSKSAVQSKWPVSLDHCFARIILDNAIGIDAPWHTKLKAPAYRNMTPIQLSDAIGLAREIECGKKSLVELNERSLQLRNKQGPASRATQSMTVKREEEEAIDQPRKKIKTNSPDLPSSLPITQKLSNPVDTPDATTTTSSFDISMVDRSSLPPFRKQVLTKVHQIPRGKWTTYQSLANSLNSSPRAIGQAMRNNPFAPEVPCHRVLAANGEIGGYGGDWGDSGRWVDEKRGRLRSEGVRFDGKGKAVGAAYQFPKQSKKKKELEESKESV